MYFLSKLRTASAVLKNKPVHQMLVRNGSDIEWNYRRVARLQDKSTLYTVEFLGFCMWYWILYHFWSEPEHIYGHFPYPDPSKWTDKELGIPPDSEG